MVQASGMVKLEHYGFSGLDASQLGAIKSVADYYGNPLSPSQIYGMTGLAFLFIIDEGLVQPNAGPQEPEIFRLARNLGVDIQGIHQYAEGETFSKLQAEAWDKARQAIEAGKPVFAKNLDIENQTSVIVAYDDAGYYTHSWHTGSHCNDVIPWNILGRSRCPCINCVNERERMKWPEDNKGLISLHWAELVPPKDDVTALREAIDFVNRLNDEGTYTWAGQRYLVGLKAYEHWIHGIGNKVVLKYWFSLMMEVLQEARSHAVIFLSGMKDKFQGPTKQSIEEAIALYREISVRCNILKTKYPYEQPREPFKDVERSEAIPILKEIMALENQALQTIRSVFL